ncbi:ABC transporter permease [Amycolatopsis sp. NPDC004079]|uniref:ABC transporter permease n=1 Tax=Amycolatopsis sp. NPDC004079 TaxID=3154549 RepID=UPI0033B9BF2D
MVVQSALLIGRNLTRTLRISEIIGSALVIPLLLYVLFIAAFAKTVLPEGNYADYANFALPGVIAFALGFALPHSGGAVQRDAEEGYLDRLRSLPIGRSVMLIGRIGADALVTGAQVVLLTLIGLLFGARFQGNLLEALVYLLAPMGIGAMLASFVVVLALRAKSAEDVSGMINLFVLPLGYISGGIVPVSALPNWLQPVAEINPLTAMVRAMRSSLEGTLHFASLWPALAWIVGGLAVAVPLAVRVDRRMTR